MSIADKYTQILERYAAIGDAMAKGDAPPEEYVRLSKEYSELGAVADAVQGLVNKQLELEDLDALLADAEVTGEMREMAETEREDLIKAIPEMEHQLQLLLLPKDAADAKNAILEIRAGTGGDEAALFALDLFTMYQRFAGLQKWKFEVMEMAENDLGGLREVIVNISGVDVFANLKFESGVHRVQRVPKTETQGRIHTSAATVAVLPEAEEVDIEINEGDLRIDVFRSSGPGGQSVNTTDSAVRITHLPTGLVVSQQDEKSQHKNKAKALKILRSRLYEQELQKQNDARSSDRKLQVGSGDRSERIRTYNFPQGRLTDHRINLTLYKLDYILSGESLHEVIDPLRSQDQADKLAIATEGVGSN